MSRPPIRAAEYVKRRTVSRLAAVWAGRNGSHRVCIHVPTPKRPQRLGEDGAGRYLNLSAL